MGPDADVTWQYDDVGGIWLLQQGAVAVYQGFNVIATIRASAILLPFDIRDSVSSSKLKNQYTFRTVKSCHLWILPIKRLQLLLEQCPSFAESLHSYQQQQLQGMRVQPTTNSVTCTD